MASKPHKQQRASTITFTPTPPPLVPWSLALCLFFIMFVLPNLVFSGEAFFDSLHLMKWVTALAPLGVLGVTAGFRLARRSALSENFHVDSFAAVWLFLLVFITLQPLWTNIRSLETFYREWFFFASLWLLYVLASLLIDRNMLRAILWGALVNAALNVLFAELQILGMNMQYPFIFPAPGNYIGNTGQQNMLALWLAIAGLGGVFLFYSSVAKEGWRRYFQNALLLVLLSVVFKGLVSSTSRSGILSLATGFALLSLFRVRLDGRKGLARIVCVCLLFAVVAGVTVSRNEKTAAALVSKLEDVLEKPLSIAKRDSIWATSWTMFTRQPWRGVGLGQFKWHYLQSMNAMRQRWPHLPWHTTHWAHNEFLQWMAEAGIGGAALMFFLWGLWGFRVLRVLWKKEALSPEAVWGSALAALFLFNALWTRPFHRIENVLWLSLAFAVTNRELLPRFPALEAEGVKKFFRPLGGIICLTSLAGLIFLADGVRGDRMLRMATEVKGNPEAAKELFKKAGRSPMVRDEAEKSLAYFLVHLGEAQGDPRMIAEGLKSLMVFFIKQPHTDELSFLNSWVPKLNDPRFTRDVHSFVYGSYGPPSAPKTESVEER